MKLLYFSDLHLADRGPSSRSPTYLEDLWAKLEEIRELAGGVDLTLFGGDWFHWPRPSATSHRLVRRTIEMLALWPTPMLVVRGNHCASAAGEIDPQPLGVVLEAFKESGRIRTWDDETNVDGETVVMAGLQLVARHWTADLDADPKAYEVVRHERARWTVIASHGMVMPPGKYPFPTVTMDEVRTEADLVLLGHMHWETPATRFNGTTWFGPGSVTRTSRSPSEAERVPAVAIIDFGTDKYLISEIPLKSARPFRDVFVWDETAELPSGSDLFAGYVATLETGLDIEGLSVEDALVRLEGRAPAAVVAKARAYLREAGL